MLASQLTLGSMISYHKNYFGYCDNINVVYLFDNPVQHQRTRHIEMDIHFVCEKVAHGQVRVLHIFSRFQIVDIFIKGLPLQHFDDFSRLSQYSFPSNFD